VDNEGGGQRGDCSRGRGRGLVVTSMAAGAGRHLHDNVGGGTVLPGIEGGAAQGNDSGREHRATTDNCSQKVSYFYPFGGLPSPTPGPTQPRYFPVLKMTLAHTHPYAETSNSSFLLHLMHSHTNAHTHTHAYACAHTPHPGPRPRPRIRIHIHHGHPHGHPHNTHTLSATATAVVRSRRFCSVPSATIIISHKKVSLICNFAPPLGHEEGRGVACLPLT
jgi:hypothetical protein